jgi:hypothetical protein
MAQPRDILGPPATGMTAQNPLEWIARAVEADHDAWARTDPTGFHRRNLAVRAALDAGGEVEDVARALHVLPRDVLDWLADLPSAG